MKLLIVTQILDKNDPVLGFFHEWVREFSKHAEKISVICLKKGVYDLPENVSVFSLGKETKLAPPFTYMIRLKLLSWKLRREYDAVLCHMNPEYVIGGALIWKMFGKKISFWYAHSTVSVRLHLAVALSDIVLTSTDEGLRIKTNKKRIIGQGIDTEMFSMISRNPSQTLRLVTVGRISPSKDYETIIAACSRLSKDAIAYELKVIGGPGTSEQQKYFNEIKNKIKILGLSVEVYFVGPLPQNEIIPYLQNADVFVSAGLTGSLDKALLEAMSCGAITISCNTAFKNLSTDTLRFSFASKDSITLEEKIKEVIEMSFSTRIDIGQKMRNIVEKDHSLSNFAEKVIDLIENI